MTTHLKIGLTPINFGFNSYPEKVAAIARAAESGGFDSVWAGAHPFISEKQTRLKPSFRMLDPMVALTFAAAHTRTVRLGTGVLLLPQFNPLILAKELASVDVLSSGRLIFGVGVGWVEHEYEALGLRYNNRGRRADDYLKAIKVLWSEDKPVYRGRYLSFDSLQSHPHPVQQPPPLVVGGSSEAAYRRAVEQANGWFGYALNVEETRRAISAIRDVSKRHSRPSELGELEISVAPGIPVDAAVAQQFADLGVHRLNLILPQDPDFAVVERFIETARSTLVGKIPVRG